MRSTRHADGSASPGGLPFPPAERRTAARPHASDPHSYHRNSQNALDQRSAYTLDDDAFDDEPMPIPSTWRTDANTRKRSSRGAVTAAIGGFLLGLLIAIPGVIMLTGRGPEIAGEINRIYADATAGVFSKDNDWFDPDRVARAPARESVVTTAAQPRTAPTEPSVTLSPGPGDGDLASGGGTEIRASVIRPAPSDEGSSGPALTEPERAVPASVQPDILVLEAKSMIANGQIGAARELLESGRGTGHGALMFALAETYDPNVLAAWGERAVAPDVARAKAAYAQALAQGVARAQLRLDALQ